MPHTLTDWLRGRSDAELVALLRRRPDLGLPTPVDLATLARRASVRTSISRALDSLDAFTLRVLEVLAGLPAPATLAELQAWFTDADAEPVRRAVRSLRDWLLIWGEDAALHPVGTVREVLGPYPAGLGRGAQDLFGAVNDIALAPLLRSLGLPPATQPRSGNSAAAAVLDRLPTLIEQCSQAERAILDRLADGPPVGGLRDAQVPGGEPGPARALLERGLLVPIDSHAVELPREVALAVRDQPAGRVRAEPEPLRLTEPGTAAIDGGGTTAVLETGEPTTALLIEVAYEAGLLSSSSNADPSYLPTTEFDGWLRLDTAERWVRLASAWLAMTRQPSMVGLRDEKERTIAALSADVERHSAPALRLQLLRLLADLPPGSAPDSAAAMLGQLAWRAPRRAVAQRSAAEAILVEAAGLGITGYGAITGYGRALLDGAETGAVRAELNATDLLNSALPPAVEEFLLQPDLTAVVPGPPTPALQRELDLAAVLESTGGASVYRIGPGSLRRALDAGRTGADLLRFFTEHSRTPVPQALEYLVNDVATQHGRLRTGPATSYLRCDDVLLLDRVLAEPALDSLGLQRIAPTVVICTSGIATLLERLRQHGFAPAAEAADGTLVSLAADAARLPARQHSRIARVRASAVSDAQLAETVNRLRAGERLASAVSNATNRVSQQVPGVTSASILELLRTAVREALTIAIGYVDDTGRPSQRTLQPISLGGGVVRGHDPLDARLHSYPLQRITTVSVLPPD
ncbi:MAG TPA: helicase-associated domain-containing protein [Jatrophihabitans sp.]|nr:helicase-associated domain-containing protein [Jatrophihabitans sp.]